MQKNINEINESSVLTYGKEYEKLSNSEKREIIQKNTGISIPADEGEFYQIVLPKTLKTMIDETRPAFANDNSGQYLTNGKYMIIDKNELWM